MAATGGRKETVARAPIIVAIGIAITQGAMHGLHWTAAAGMVGIESLGVIEVVEVIGKSEPIDALTVTLSSAPTVPPGQH